MGVFTDRLIALITFRPDGNDVYEVHIDCQRGASKDDLLTALLSIEPVIFNDWGAQQIFGGIISRNGGILAIAEACGLRKDGVEETVGRHKWIRVSKTSDEFYQNQHRNIAEHGHLRTDARRIVA